MRGLVAIASVPVLASLDAGADLVTELISGERLEVTEYRGDWLKALVPPHRTRLDPGGYPGWIRADAPLVEADGFVPDLNVVSANRSGLPLGALLESGDGFARLPGGRTVELGDGEALPVGKPAELSAADLSRRLLGLPYRWGGTDSTEGMDCSGMVYRVMQARGVEVPRDADDQFDHAPFSSREHWENARPNDLVFFGEDAVTHVGFYLGEGSYISEHGSSGAVVRGVDEDPYWGFARYES